MKKFIVKTLGCKANYSDGQLLEAGLSDLGFAPALEMEDADVVIVNSCTVTDEADKQSRKMIRDALKKNPAAKVIYTGCGAEVDPEAILQAGQVSAVVGNQDKTRAAALIAEHVMKDSGQPVILGSVSSYAELTSRHPHDREWAMPESGVSEILKLDESHSTYRTRAFIKIQEGCNSFCTYCIIPYGRGPARSLPIEKLVEEVQKLVKAGVQEVVLTGTNIGDYGIDWAPAENPGPKIDDLIEALLTDTALPRLRVSSLDPTEISERMIRLMEDHPRFCPHFHVSLQNVNSKVLKLMKRKYSFAEVEACLTRLSRMKRMPFIGMDYITGFPGETREDFEASVETLKKLYWHRLHVFPYSERSETPATRLPNSVEMSERKARAKVLQALSLERLTEFYAQTRQGFSGSSGLLKGVLLESRVKGPDGTKNWISGYAPNYQRVVIPAEGETIRNQVVDIAVNRWFIDRASGEVCWLADGALAERV